MIVWLASYPKSGNTWVRIFLNSLFYSNTSVSDINNLKIGEITKPIILSNGILVLKIMNIKKSIIAIDVKSEFKKAINYERNRQLNQYSKIHYNKIKKNLDFNE